TRVLTHRIAYLVRTDRARAGEILAITFTNKAAQEMRERVELLVGRRVRAMWVMTFHSACARMLRADAQRLGYTRQFTIYDQADSRRLVKRCLDDLDVEYQDTNHAQYRWLQLLAGEGTGDESGTGHRNLAVVGDDDQSIYRFRGADIKNILEFEEDFPDAHVIRLEENYRSTQMILD